MNPKIQEHHRSKPAYIYLRQSTPGQVRPPSGEHGAPVCPAGEGAGTGLERVLDSARWTGTWERRGRR